MGYRIAMLYGSRDLRVAARINRDAALLGTEVALLAHSGRGNVLKSTRSFDCLALLITPNGPDPGHLQIIVDGARKNQKLALALIHPGAHWTAWELMEDVIRIHLDVQRPGRALERILNDLSETGMERWELRDLYAFTTIAFAAIAIEL